jgi:AcrR family transcriptional regulator
MRPRLDLRAAASALADGEPTMAQVAARLGIAKPTLYKLAGSRDALVRTCVETEAERVLDHLYGSDGDLAAVTRALEAYARDSPGGFRLLFERREPGAEEVVRRLETRLGGLRGAALLGAAAGIVSRAHVEGIPARPPARVPEL